MNSSESYKDDTSLTGYIPLLQSSTFAINYFRSDATVTRTGITDEDYLLELNRIRTKATGRQGDGTTLAALPVTMRRTSARR